MRKGEEARGTERLEDERRDWKRLSKGRKEGVGLSSPGLEATEGRTLLPPGEESTEPCNVCQKIVSYFCCLTYLNGRRIIWD